MKYQEKSFQVAYGSKKYRENWDNAFSNGVRKVDLKIGDLVAVKEHRHHLPWFGTVAQIREQGDIPHTGDPESCIRIDWLDPNNSESLWSWEKREDIYFVKRNFEKRWEKVR